MSNFGFETRNLGNVVRGFSLALDKTEGGHYSKEAE